MKNRFYVVAGALVCLTLPGFIRADVIAVSQAGQALVTNVCNSGTDPAATLYAPSSCSGGTNSDSSTQSVQITPDPEWGQLTTDPSAEWISNYASGYENSQFQYADNASAIFTLTTADFTLANAASVTVDVLADDTATVILHNVTTNTSTTLWMDDLTPGPACAAGIVGCLTTTEGIATLNLAADRYNVEFEPFQQGSATDTTGNPFGLSYAVSVPEAGSLLFLAFMGSTLFGAKRILRKRA